MVIIGAGICGLATAVALNKKGIKSVVMEKSESLRNVTGAAIGIRQNGWRALDQLGVADILRPTAISLQRERMVLLKEGKQQQSSMIGETRCLRRKDLLNTLYDALPPDTVKFGCQLKSIKLNLTTNKPVLRFINGRSIIAKVVIGCEGGRSIVAEYLNVKPTKMFPSCNVRGITNCPNGHSFDAEFVRFRSDNNLVGRIPIDDKSVYWFCGHPYIPGG
ncbi:monooxygenase 1-like [Rutidosis leptorrhynchoides]|uniref:monooxygenase 1-like n=1 Tax=Rutidosis leptorrhynchoides TaxID=125765 RepID=UPI003A994316